MSADSLATTAGGVAAGPGDTGLAVPASAVFNVRADEGFVYLLDAKGSKVRARAVQIGKVDDRQLIITGGVKAGDRMIGMLVDAVSLIVVTTPILLPLILILSTVGAYAINNSISDYSNSRLGLLLSVIQ